jgi:succinate dehydrogenase / fumarate reductase, cytochrome b subunit
MSDTLAPTAKKRPEFRNINAFTDLTTYRLPLAGYVSILHRISGALMFLLLPFALWMFDKSVSSEISFSRFKAAFNIGMLGLPGFAWKLLALALIWAFTYHVISGLRHLWMDTHHSATTKEFGKTSALITLISSTLLVLALGAKLFGLY